MAISPKSRSFHRILSDKQTSQALCRYPVAATSPTGVFSLFYIRCELWSVTPEQIKDLCRSCFRFSFHAHLRGRDSSFILFSVQDLCRRPTQLNQIQKIQLSSPSTMTKRTGVALSWSHRQNMLMLLFFSSRWKVLSGKFIIYIDWKLIWWWNMKRLLSIGIHRQ